MRPVAEGTKDMPPFNFYAVCFLVFSFTAVFVLLFLEQDDGPSVPRRTMPAVDEASPGQGPRGTRPTGDEATGGRGPRGTRLGKRSPRRTRPQ